MVRRKSRKTEYYIRIELHTEVNSQQNQCLQEDPGLISSSDFFFYCYAITVVCLFSPSLYPTPGHQILLLGGLLCLGCVPCLFRVVQVDASLFFFFFWIFKNFLKLLFKYSCLHFPPTSLPT